MDIEDETRFFEHEIDICPFCAVELDARHIVEDDYEYFCPECGYVSHTD